MNQKLILSFVAGIIVASGVSYFVANRPVSTASSAPPAEPASPAVNPPLAATSSTTPPAPVPEDVPAKTASRVKSTPTPAVPSSTAKSKPNVEPTASSGRAEQKEQETISAKAPAAPPAAEPPAKPAATADAVSIHPPSAEKKPAAPVESRILRPESASGTRVSAAPPRVPNTVTIPQGTPLSVRLGEGLSTDRNVTGDEFTGTLNEPLVVNDLVIAERGARVEGRVAESVKAGRVRGLAHLSIELTRLHTSDGQNIAIRTSAIAKDGPESKKEDAAKVGIGAALGAVIGGIAGGGKGAAIGAAAGGAAGGGTVAATRGKPAVLPVETPLHFQIQESVTVTERLN